MMSADEAARVAGELHARARAYAAELVRHAAAVRGTVIGEDDIAKAFVVGFMACAETLANVRAVPASGPVLPLPSPVIRRRRGAR